ncbi:Ankyrin repeat protein 1 [Giardia muris]|uniref:Ankyrin repeat protein 1 n=1 Tax=Giardia muris TaxID=5742 RepID=A0A4Z1SV42_GIAMU|nr:Ankyrin repeat protein 1 [Giardia muris]|eukprot:TNJ29752.1 Ankyrin repeat protein 1 [Giardia muris]
MAHAWFRAASQGDVSFLSLQYHRYACSSNERGLTALMVAVKSRQIDAIELLTPLEARLTTPRGTTALMIAAEEGFHEAVVFLAPSEGRMRTAETALIRAVKAGDTKMVSLLLPYEACYASECIRFAELSKQYEVSQLLRGVVEGGIPPLPDMQLTVRSLGSATTTERVPLISEELLATQKDLSMAQDALHLATSRMEELEMEVDRLRATASNCEGLVGELEQAKGKIAELSEEVDVLFNDNRALRLQQDKSEQALKRLGPCPKCRQMRGELRTTKGENVRLIAENMDLQERVLQMSYQVPPSIFTDEEIRRLKVGNKC